MCKARNIRHKFHPFLKWNQMYCINFNMLMSSQPWKDSIFMISIKYLTIGGMLKIVQYLTGMWKDLGFDFSWFLKVLQWNCCSLGSIQELYSAFPNCSPQTCWFAAADRCWRTRRSSKKWEVAKLTASKEFLWVLFLSSGKKNLFPWVRLEKGLVLIHINKKTVSSW